jgi:hypothetical protein
MLQCLAPWPGSLRNEGGAGLDPDRGGSGPQRSLISPLVECFFGLLEVEDSQSETPGSHHDACP